MALATRMLLVMLTLGRRGNGRKDMVLVVAAAAAALHGSEEVAAAAALDQHHRPLAVEQGRALLLLQLRPSLLPLPLLLPPLFLRTFRCSCFTKLYCLWRS